MTASYREVRNFTEIMRSLGYPRHISIENFRTPNFKLVAEILSWLIQRYDPSADLPTGLDLERSESDRVMFIKAVAQFMAVRGNMKLNTKRLYQADNTAVRELLQIASVLNNAVRAANIDELTNSLGSSSAALSFELGFRVNDLKEARRLASEISTKGAGLHELLGHEVELREARQAVIGRELNVGEVERGMQASLQLLDAEIRKVHKNLENIAADEANLESKIERKRLELERNQKRLATLQSVRPAYQDEFEALEKDLEKLYEQYVLKFRNLSYLESQVNELERHEREQLEQVEIQVRALTDKLRDSQQDRGDELDDEFSGVMDDFATSEGDVDESAPGGAAGSNARPSAPIGGRRRPMAPPEFGGGVGLKGGKPSPARGAAIGANYGSMGLELEDEEDEREVSRQMGEMRAQRRREEMQAEMEDLDDEDDEDEEGLDDDLIESGRAPASRAARPSEAGGSMRAGRQPRGRAGGDDSDNDF